MPRTKGAKNYQKEILYSVVKEVLPTGHFAWEQVAAVYKEQSKEVELRDIGDVCCHWKDKLVTDSRNQLVILVKHMISFSSVREFRG